MENFIIISLFVGLGALFRRLSAFPEQTPQVLNMFALYASLPAVILLKVPGIQFSKDMLVPAIVPWLMLILSAALAIAAGLLLELAAATLSLGMVLSFLSLPMLFLAI